MEKQVLFGFDMDFEHDRWKEEIVYCNNELNFFNSKLSEFITRWTNKEVLDEIRHYQEEFVFHLGVMDDLLETIEQHETDITAQRKAGILSLDAPLTKKHLEFRNLMEKQRELYNKLKKEFLKFIETHS